MSHDPLHAPSRTRRSPRDRDVEAVAAVSLLQQLRDLGLPMGSWYPAHDFTTTNEAGEEVTVRRRRYIGWTTDDAKAQAAADLGAVVIPYRSELQEFCGHEVTVTEVEPGD